jgi:ethanolamine utilization protein EutQ (cupin superfamily)
VYAHDALMIHFPNAQKAEIASLKIDGVNAFLQDVVSSNDPNAPISCGFFRMEKGNPLEYTYSYDEAKIILEGEMTIAEVGGDTIEAKPGDVLYFEEGAKITFSSKSSGLGFYCGQRTAEGL